MSFPRVGKLFNKQSDDFQTKTGARLMAGWFPSYLEKKPKAQSMTPKGANLIAKELSLAKTGPFTPRKFNIASKTRQSQKETHLPTTIFQGLC